MNRPTRPGSDDDKKDREMTKTTHTITYTVSGMTCGHCVTAVTEEVSALTGVTGVEIDLVAGGLSRLRVSADEPVAQDAVGITSRASLTDRGSSGAPQSASRPHHHPPEGRS
jgi:copper chaperone